MKLSMLALVTDAYGGRGGIAQYNRDFLGEVAGACSFSSVTILPRQAPDAPAPPKRIKQLPSRPGRLWYSILALRTAFFSPLDLVFCGHLFMVPLALLIARLKDARLIVQMHGIEAWPRPSWVQRFAVEQADLVLCVSRHTRAAVLSWAAIVPERILVLPNTVRELFAPGDGSRQRSTLGVDGKSVLLTVGRLDSQDRYKGYDCVIAAIPGLVARDHDICYLIVGDGDDRSRLEALACELGVSDRVRFLGAVPVESLPEIYRSADLFVMPSTGEGFGVVFLEAMACGTPALGFAAAGARDALADGELGTMTSESELVTTISRLLLQPKPDSKKLHAAVCARFGRDKFAANASAALQRVAEQAVASTFHD